MPNDVMRGLKDIMVEAHYDCIGTAAGDGVILLNSSDTGDTAFAINAAGPVFRGSTTTTNNNMIELSHGLVAFQAQDSYMMMECRAYLDVVTNVAFCIGFNDESLEGANTIPVELSTTTFTRQSTNFFGLMYDVDATNDDIHVIWADDSALTDKAIADLRMVGINPAASENFLARVEGHDNGAGNGLRGRFRFNRNNAAGTSAEKEFNTSVDRDQRFAAYTGWENRSATAHQVNIEFIHIVASRP